MNYSVNTTWEQSYDMNGYINYGRKEIAEIHLFDDKYILSPGKIYQKGNVERIIISLQYAANATKHSTIQDGCVVHYTTSDLDEGTCTVGEFLEWLESEEINVTGTELEVCRDIATRQKIGITKYGKTVEQNPLSLQEWLQHAYEECLDQAIYLKRAIQELNKDGEKN